MENSSSNSEAYEFAGIRLDSASRELTREGEPVEVQKRVLDLLLFLLKNRDRAVSKEELQGAVWPGTIVTETALTRAVMKARRVVGDDANTQAVIKTIHGHGYRFVAELTATEVVDAEEDHAEQRRDLLRVATAYGAIAWLINQAAAMIWEAFEFDKLPLQILVGISIAGLPLVLAIAWIYQVTPQGLKRRDEVTSSQRTPPRHRDRAIIAMLLVALGLSLFWNLRPEDAAAPTTARIAVMPVTNTTGAAELEWVELGAMSFMTSLLRDRQIATVSPRSVLRIVDSGAEPDPELLATLAEQTGATHVLVARLTGSRQVLELSATMLSDGEKLELPSYTGPNPTGLARQLAGYLADSLGTVERIQSRSLASGDLFVDEAYARGLHLQITGNLSEARRLLEVAADGAPTLFWPRYELAQVDRSLGNIDQSIESLLELLDESRAAGALEQVAMASNAIGISLDTSGDLDAAHDHYLEGIEAATQGGYSQTRGHLLVNLAILERTRANPQKTREYLGQALAAYRDAGIAELPGDFYVTLGNADADLGDYDGARRQYEKALSHYQSSGQRRQQALALANLAFAAQKAHNFEKALAYLDQSLAIRIDIDDHVGELRSRIRKADIHHSRGELDEALTELQRVQDSPHIDADSNLTSTVLAIRGYVALARNESQAAFDLFEVSREIESARGTLALVLRAELGQVKALAQLQRLDDATALAESVIEGAQQYEQPVYGTQARIELANIAMSRGDHNTAFAQLTAAVDEARLVSSNQLEGEAAMRLAEFHLERGRADEAEPWIGLAHTLHPQSGHVARIAARVSWHKGQFEQAAEQMDDARAKLRAFWTDEDEQLRQEFRARAELAKAI